MKNLETEEINVEAQIGYAEKRIAEIEAIENPDEDLIEEVKILRAKLDNLRETQNRQLVD